MRFSPRIACSLLRFLPAACLAVCLAACSSAPEPTPRPRAYHRLEFPQRSYRSFSSPNCPFQFDYPAQGEVVLLDSQACKLDINFPQYDCRWHFTLRDFRREETNAAQSAEEFRRVVYKHSQRANLIEPTPVQTPAGQGFYYELYGNVPEPAAFHLSDNRRYALMGAFYFNTSERNDSLRPVIDYLKPDFRRLMEQVRWE